MFEMPSLPRQLWCKGEIALFKPSSIGSKPTTGSVMMPTVPATR